MIFQSWRSLQKQPDTGMRLTLLMVLYILGLKWLPHAFIFAEEHEPSPNLTLTLSSHSSLGCRDMSPGKRVYSDLLQRLTLTSQFSGEKRRRSNVETKPWEEEGKGKLVSPISGIPGGLFSMLFNLLLCYMLVT